MISIERFALNTQGRDFLITDPHSCYDEVVDLLRLIKFDKTVDRFFINGDLCDRGPKPIEMIKLLGEDWVHASMGNHDVLPIGIAYGKNDKGRYAQNGGQWFLDLPQTLRKAFAEVFATLPLLMEIETPHGLVGCVHAEPFDTWAETVHQANRVSPFISNNEVNSITGKLMWSRRRVEIRPEEADQDRVIPDCTPIPDIWRVYVGHTVFDDFIAPVYGNIHYIDTGVVFGGKLTCVNLTENTIIEVPARKEYWVFNRK
jgi:serine/threonine protein phosphatase 1